VKRTALLLLGFIFIAFSTAHSPSLSRSFCNFSMSSLSESERSVCLLYLTHWNRIHLEQQNLCQRIQQLLLNSTFRCLLHKTQTYEHTLSYYLSYSLTWPNITPAFSIRSFPHFFFCGHKFKKIVITGMYSICFTHQSRSAYSICSVAYDTFCLLTSARWSSQLTTEHSWILLLYRQFVSFVTVTQHCFAMSRAAFLLGHLA
jgi:hypothetical protein